MKGLQLWGVLVFTIGLIFTAVLFWLSIREHSEMLFLAGSGMVLVLLTSIYERLRRRRKVENKNN